MSPPRNTRGTAPSRPETAFSGFDTQTVQRIAAFFDIFVHARETVNRFDRTFKDIAEALRQTLNAAEVTIWVPNEQVRAVDPATGEPLSTRGAMHPAFTSFPADLARRLPLEVPLPASREGRVFEAGEARFDAGLDGAPPPAGAAVLQGQGLTRMWSVPLRVQPHRSEEQGSIVAVADMAYPDDAPAADIPPELVDLCGRLAGRAIERALGAEHELVVQKAFEALDVLEQDRFDAMDPVAAAIAESMQFEACTILLADVHTRTLHLLGTTGVDSRRPRRLMRYSFDFSCSGRVARTRQILATEDLDACSAYEGPKYTDRVESEGFRQYLGAPVLSHADELLGVVRLRNKRPPVGRSWPRCLNALDWMRVQRTARVLAPVMSLMIKDMRMASMLERVRHDMDMPATMIRDSAGHLRREDPERLARRLPALRQKLEDIESLAEILLLNSELLRVHDAQSLPFEPEFIQPMGDFVARLCKMLNSAARRKGLAGILYVDDSFRTIPRLWLDPRFMQIALYNLLQNAIKYSTDDQLVLVEGATRKIDGEPWYLISVRNQGIGVPEEDVDRIFERNYRSPRAVRKNSTGLGLGLFIARRMVERHGGRLELTQRHNPTELTILLPGHLAERKPT